MPFRNDLFSIDLRVAVSARRRRARFIYLWTDSTLKQTVRSFGQYSTQQLLSRELRLLAVFVRVTPLEGNSVCEKEQ